MKKLFQTEWHGIKFSSFAVLNQKEIATVDFYKSFYSVLFNKYNDYSELDESWRESKAMIARFITNQFQLNNKKIGSIGCGIGYVEYLLSQFMH